MLVREPDTRSPSFFATMGVIGVIIEFLVLISAQAASRLDLIDGLAGQGLMFLLVLSLVYLGSQVLGLLHAIPPVAGMSLALLATLLGWLGAFAAFMMLLTCIGMLLVSFVWLPVAAVLRRTGRKGGWKAASMPLTARSSDAG